MKPTDNMIQERETLQEKTSEITCKIQMLNLKHWALSSAIGAMIDIKGANAAKSEIDQANYLVMIAEDIAKEVDTLIEQLIHIQFQQEKDQN